MEHKDKASSYSSSRGRTRVRLCCLDNGVDYLVGSARLEADVRRFIEPVSGETGKIT